DLVVIAEIDLAQPARLRSAAAKILPPRQLQTGRAAIGAAGMVDEIVRQGIDLDAELDVPDLVPGRTLVGARCDAGLRGERAEGSDDQPGGERDARHGSIRSDGALAAPGNVRYNVR